ncbi:hypothetical protein [Phenylobacterium montanum]|uniref:Uncharacterized protein n=1 Tax=Phenylobacterium montanum TaxID=2823693 RepID=A0A975G0B1_9CAUL|nr:hypothetical protein [Caulobacter sp. S6]QUD87611.1 hypothetical protein KCG34_21585 [Caulobacter sp. S6]
MTLVAVVARRRYQGFEYLARDGQGNNWSTVERDARLYPSVHEATRAALRLPGKVRAFALPICH